MQLSLISKTHANSKAHLVFLHGACLGTWIWEEHFMTYFYDQGYSVHAFDFRNHGKSEGPGYLRWNSIQDYVADLKSVLQQIEGPVVLVGHSMGGMTIQHYLKDCDSKVKAAVMLCAVPRQGVWTLIGKLILNYPFSFLESTLRASWLPILRNPARLKKLMFRADFPESQIKQVQEKLQDESFWVFLQMLFNRPKVPKNHPPVFVVGGSDDFLFPTSQTKSLADTYQSECFILPGGSHSLMMESGWEIAAKEVHDFLTEIVVSKAEN